MKVKITNYIFDNKEDIKYYKNVEKLKVIEVSKINVDSSKIWEKKFFCQNQNGNIVEKSDFMLKYGYSKNEDGTYSPLKNKKVKALIAKFKIEFSDSEGEICRLIKGDYIVMSDDKIFGMKKANFEENFILTKAPKKRIVKKEDAEEESK